MKSVLHVLTTTAFLVGIFSTIVRAEPPFELWGARWRQTSPALLLPQRRDHALTAQVETDLRNAQRSQTKGDLTAARNSAISAWIEADIEHSIPTTSRSLNPILLFPEGDALHFFAWNTATELVYIDLSHDIVKLAWRASMNPTDPAAAAASTKSSAPYTFVREEVVLHEDGVRPEITKPLVFFEVQYNTFGGLLYGRVTQSGDFIAIGRDALTWQYPFGPKAGEVTRGAITNVSGRWVAWPKVRSIPGERDGFAKVNRQPAGTVAMSNAGQAFARLAHQYVAKGDLTDARNAALAAWAHAGIAGSVAGHGDALQEVYLFPKGQALRFFDWNKQSRMTYIEIRGDSVMLVWATDYIYRDRQLEDGRTVPWPSNLMPSVPFKFSAGSMMTFEVGHRPDVDGALVFFQAQFAVPDLEVGRVEVDGSLHLTNGAALKSSNGHFNVVPIPDEHIAAPAELPK